MEHYIKRAIELQLLNLAKWFPVVSVSGPRQSGKSTLVRHAFPDYDYINLEDPQVRASAIEDPVSFIRNRSDRLIIDEAQYAPDLFSIIQVASDERGVPGQYVLTGSQNFLMMKSISQSLAGRVGLLKLMPFAFSELQGEKDASLSVDCHMLQGGYPRLHTVGIPPQVFFQNYIDTYIERDVSGLLDVRNKASFHKLLSLCAQNAGGLVNMTAFANAADVSVPTVKSWLSILESSYLVFRLKPYSANLRKRLTKMPKLYFYDTGLLCHLLGIKTAEQLALHPCVGAIFENLIVAELMKKHLNNGDEPQVYFYRDDSKREVDLIDATDPGRMQMVEVKSSRMYHGKYARALNAVGDDLGVGAKNRFVVARVESSYRAPEVSVISAEDWLLGASPFLEQSGTTGR